MRRTISTIFAIIFAAALTSLAAEKDNLPRLPGAVLLVGHPDGALFVTTPDHTWTLQTTSTWWIEPTISRDGLTVASAQEVDPAGGFAIGVYSGPERKWTELKRLRKFFGKIAVSPDGSRIAFACLVDGDPYTSQMHVIDVSSGKEKITPLNQRGGFDLSWSPDGRRIVYATAPLSYPKSYLERKNAPQSRIVILDVETGITLNVADGHLPSWAPSGERIIYIHTTDRVLPWKGPDSWIEDPSPVHLMQIHPDGTGSKILIRVPKIRFLGILFPEERGFWGSMVFSPDGKTILLNQPWNYTEAFRLDTYLLDLSTLKMKRKLRKAPAIFGWAAAK